MIVEVFRHSRDAWGRDVLEGVSWDLLWMFAAAAALFIVAHMAYMKFKS